MAQEAGWGFNNSRSSDFVKAQLKFANLVAAAEREACAKLCEQPIDEIQITDDCNETIYKDYQDCADAIRARGQE
jgi:hypothetical protein